MRGKIYITALFCSLLAGCATAPHKHDQSKSVLRANQVVTVADDFVVDVYLNGVRIPDEKRELVAEIYGATVERVNLRVYQGDWLVFHVVNDRMRWGGCCYFATAGIFQPNEFGFVSETKSGNWTACDDPAKARRFIEHKRYLKRDRASPFQKPGGMARPI